MTGTDHLSERALILAPTGRDGQIATLILAEAGFGACVCGDLAMLCKELAVGAGLALIADEAIRHADLHGLFQSLRNQPPWSDLPIILMTERGGGPERNPAAARSADLLGNVSFIERPFHPTTLTSMVRSAIRGRRRQYEARARLEELGSTAQQLQTALRAGDLGSWILDLETLQIRASDTCAAQYGQPAGGEFTFAGFEGLIHPDDVERVRAAAGRTLSTGEDYVVEYRIVRPDGTMHWIDARAGPIADEEGGITHLVGVSSDITARKSFELERERLIGDLASEREALSNLTHTLEQRVALRTAELADEVVAREKMQDQLLQSQKMESLGQLTGGVAHDFNNLLTAVMGNLQLLSKHVAGDARAERLIDGAMRGAERGASLTQRMLAFARQQDLKTKITDLTLLVTGMREFLGRTLGPQIQLVVDAGRGLPAVRVDPHQVELAILNLAINARDAMPEGGRITISVREKKAGGSNGAASTAGVEIRVADTGIGMDADTLKRAIDPFFSTKPLGKGTGLGLSMAHGLARQLDGSLELTSTPGQGATASLWFPASLDPAAPPPSAPAQSSATCSPATILVVDDDALIGMSTADMLEDLGHTVITAESGPQALEILDREAGIDLLLTDHAMPGMTGVELAERVRGKRPDMPILLATGFADAPLTQGPHLPRLAKPYLQAQLQAEINKLLSGGAA